MNNWTHWSMCLITFKSITSDREWLFVMSCTDCRLLGNCPTWLQLYGSAPHWCCLVSSTILLRSISSPPAVGSGQPKGRKLLPVQVQHEESQSVSVGHRQVWDGPIHDSSAVVFISQLWHTQKYCSYMWRSVRPPVHPPVRPEVSVCPQQQSQAAPPVEWRQ